MMSLRWTQLPVPEPYHSALESLGEDQREREAAMARIGGYPAVSGLMELTLLGLANSSSVESIWLMAPPLLCFS